MTIRGLLSADDITTGNLSVSYLTSGTIAGSSIVLGALSNMQSSNYILNTSGWKLFGNGAIEVNDTVKMTLADYSGTLCFIKSDNFAPGTTGWRLSGDGSVDIPYLVNTSTAQTVGGVKTFTNGIIVNADIDCNQNEILELVIENRTDDPASPVTGQVWFRTDI
jgi:hypothetical protein